MYRNPFVSDKPETLVERICYYALVLPVQIVGLLLVAPLVLPVMLLVGRHTMKNFPKEAENA